jgi:hypothetical protein
MPTGVACRYGDESCPCQDGLQCHYEGANALLPPSAPKTPAQRKAEERRRHKAAGRVAVLVYVQPRAREALRRYVKRLNAHNK